MEMKIVNVTTVSEWLMRHFADIMSHIDFSQNFSNKFLLEYRKSKNNITVPSGYKRFINSDQMILFLYRNLLSKYYQQK